MKCAWCMYKFHRLGKIETEVRDAVTINGGDALCGHHYIDWTVLRATVSWRFSIVIELLKSEI